MPHSHPSLPPTTATQAPLVSPSVLDEHFALKVEQIKQDKGYQIQKLDFDLSGRIASIPLPSQPMTSVPSTTTAPPPAPTSSDPTPPPHTPTPPYTALASASTVTTTTPAVKIYDTISGLESQISHLTLSVAKMHDQTTEGLKRSTTSLDAMQAEGSQQKERAARGWRSWMARRWWGRRRQ